ncbi:MAG TPA: hypothetical protein VKK79_12825 [Candidatus Lokiarchaeia archaeon]|nr:hypothetical protein [Candidatus Lokiarchaeia archaeon]
MQVPHENQVKELIVGLNIFLGFYVVVAVFQDIAAAWVNSGTFLTPPLPVGGAVLGVVIGILFFNYFTTSPRKLRQETLFLLYTLLLGIGGIAYSFMPLAATLVGLGAPGLFFLVAPAHDGEWQRKLFGVEPGKRWVVGIPAASFVALYTILALAGLPMSVDLWFAVVLIVIGVFWGIWVFRGSRLPIKFTPYEEIPAEMPISERNMPEAIPMPKYLQTLFTILGWNFLFLLLVEFWSQFLLLPAGGTFTLDPQIVGALTTGMVLGVVIMLLLQLIHTRWPLRGFLLSLGCLITFFAVLLAEYTAVPAVTTQASAGYTFASLLFLPSAVAGVFQCAPSDYQGSWIRFLRNVLVFVAIGFCVISTQIIPQFLVIQGLNNMMPTVFLLNLIFLGIMFIVNILQVMPVPAEDVISDQGAEVVVGAE